MPRPVRLNPTGVALLADINDGYVAYQDGRFRLTGDDFRSSEVTVDGRVRSAIHAGWVRKNRDGKVTLTEAGAAMLANWKGTVDVR